MKMIIQEKNYNSDGQRTAIPNHVKLSLTSLKNIQDAQSSKVSSDLGKLWVYVAPLQIFETIKSSLLNKQAFFIFEITADDNDKID